MKSIINFLKGTILFFVIVFVFCACKKENMFIGDNGNVTLQGIVYDVSGNPLSGVSVVTGSLNATTDTDGKFSFSKAGVIDKRAVIKFEKNGYFTLTRSRVKENDMFIDAVLYPQGNSNISLQTTFDASSAKTLEIGAMKVKLPASSVVRADGSTYSGTVNANMLYLDPNNDNFAGLMPGGDLLAIRNDNSEVILISYGMINVNLIDNSGNPLQLKSGSSAELTFPIPAGMTNGAPASIPLWHFDEEKGIWIEDGVATLKGGVYEGTVTHFSWVNLDIPEQVVTIKGKVVDCEYKPILYVKVYSGQTFIYTNNKGEYMGNILANTPVTLKVIANGGSDSKNLPEYQSGSIQIVSDLKVPCGGHVEKFIQVEKGCVVYEMYESGWIGYFPSLNKFQFAGFYILTFDNYGRRARVDYVNKSDTVSYDKSYCTAIWNDMINQEYTWDKDLKNYRWKDGCGILLNVDNSDSVMFNYAPYHTLCSMFKLYVYNGYKLEWDLYISKNMRHISSTSVVTIDNYAFNLNKYVLNSNLSDIGYYDANCFWNLGFWNNVLMQYIGVIYRERGQVGSSFNPSYYLEKIIARRIDIDVTIPPNVFDMGSENLGVTWINK